MKYRIAHVGAFDFENFGDLLFTDVLKKSLKKGLKLGKLFILLLRHARCQVKMRVYIQLPNLKK